MKVFYIGDDFYTQSNSYMSSVYIKKTHAKTDWGFIMKALSLGESVTITPATDQETDWAHTELERILKIIK